MVWYEGYTFKLIKKVSLVFLVPGAGFRVPSTECRVLVPTLFSIFYFPDFKFEQDYSTVASAISLYLSTGTTPACSQTNPPARFDKAAIRK